MKLIPVWTYRLSPTPQLHELLVSGVPDLPHCFTPLGGRGVARGGCMLDSAASAEDPSWSVSNKNWDRAKYLYQMDGIATDTTNHMRRVHPVFPEMLGDKPASASAGLEMFLSKVPVLRQCPLFATKTQNPGVIGFLNWLHSISRPRFIRLGYANSKHVTDSRIQLHSSLPHVQQVAMHAACTCTGLSCSLSVSLSPHKPLLSSFHIPYPLHDQASQ